MLTVSSDIMTITVLPHDYHMTITVLLLHDYHMTITVLPHDYQTITCPSQNLDCPQVIDALVVSMDLIAKSVDGKKKVGELRIFLFTDAASEHSDDCLGEICAGLKKLNIHLLIM